MDQIAKEDRRKKFKKGVKALERAFQSQFDMTIAKGTPDQFEQLVAKYLKAIPEDQEHFLKRNTETQDPMDRDPQKDLDHVAACFAYLKNVRSLGNWAWKTSETIGENVLWYDPIPGTYIPCALVEELGNEKAMAL